MPGMNVYISDMLFHVLVRIRYYIRRLPDADYVIFLQKYFRIIFCKIRFCTDLSVSGLVRCRVADNNILALKQRFMKSENMRNEKVI